MSARSQYFTVHTYVPSVGSTRYAGRLALAGEGVTVPTTVAIPIAAATVSQTNSRRLASNEVDVVTLVLGGVGAKAATDESDTINAVIFIVVEFNVYRNAWVLLVAMPLVLECGSELALHLRRRSNNNEIQQQTFSFPH